MAACLRAGHASRPSCRFRTRRPPGERRRSFSRPHRPRSLTTTGSITARHDRRKTRAGARIKNAQGPAFRKPLQGPDQGHAVEHVVDEKVRRVLPGTEAVHAVPSIQALQVGDQLLALARRRSRARAGERPLAVARTNQRNPIDTDGAISGSCGARHVVAVDFIETAQAALSQVNQKQRNGCGRDTGNPRGLAKRRRPLLIELLPNLEAQRGHLRVVEFRREPQRLVRRGALDLILLPLDVARVLDRRSRPGRSPPRRVLAPVLREVFHVKPGRRPAARPARARTTSSKPTPGRFSKLSQAVLMLDRLADGPRRQFRGHHRPGTPMWT